METKSTFLPEDYKMPTTSSYMKLKEGANKFRVLSPAVVGWEYWNTANKPVRSKTPLTVVPDDIRFDDGLPTPIKHFWAFCVWNYDTKRVEILEITQKSIHKDLISYGENSDWGDPMGYDITITRSGSGFETRYQVAPSPHKPLPPEVKKAAEESTIKLEALFESKDPFATSDKSGLTKKKIEYPKGPLDDIPF